jgi:thymidylate synthase
MNTYEENYSAAIHLVAKKGEKINSRNGKVRQLTGIQIRANLREGFPIVTGKKIFPKSIFVEVEWLLRGETNVKFLQERGVTIWNQWAKEDGDLGPVYGKQIRDFEGVDQLKNLIKDLKSNYTSRRHLISMWNPIRINEMELPPCHYAFQLVTYPDHIDIVVSMRSLDLFIGLPYDVGMYATILSIIAKELNKKPGEVIINAAACHLYEEHVSKAAIYAGRKKKALPTLVNCPKFSEFSYDKMILENYNPDSRLEVKVKK